ncbi:MAG TPA: hypothetical protein VIV60_21710 [Polyangiaceae bacterium]
MTYLLALVLCTQDRCYQHRLYSPKEYPTLEACESAPVMLELHPSGTDLKIRCLTPEEWASLPAYPTQSTRRASHE